MTVGRSPLATSSLGAVGGARGTAAGGLRILIEFLTQYDSAAVKALEKDLTELSNLETQASNKSLAAQRALDTAQKKTDALAKERARIVSTLAKKPSTVRSDLKEIEQAGVLSKLGQQRLSNLDAELGAHGKLVRVVTQQARLAQTQNARAKNLANLESERLAIQEQQLAVQSKLSFFQNLRGSVLPRLGGLAAGAIGGVFGGALIGVGFAAAQAGLDAIEQQLLDIFDPARHARDVLKEVADAINKFAESDDNAGDRKQGALEFLKQYGITADEATVNILAQAAADQTGVEQLEARKKVLEIILHQEELRKKLIKDITDLTAKEQGVNPDGFFDLKDLGIAGQIAAQAERDLANAQNAAALAAQEAAQEAYNLEQARRSQAAAAQLATFAEQQLISAIRAGAASGVSAITSQIETLQNAGPSARTLALQAKIEKLQEAGSGGSSRNQELANIAEERALILLRQRLRLLGTAIDLEKFEGKFLLEAINSKIKALQKEAAAQDRINKLLDLQFRASQVLRRNEGESISDFLERRAQENRSILSEQRDLEREAVEDSLRELQEKTQDEVSLAELAERKKNAAAKTGADSRIKSLQKELQASQKADAAATKAKIEALEKQRKALEQLAEKAEEYATQAKNDQIREAISAADTIVKLQSISGEIAGLTAAKNFVRALVMSGAFTGPEAARLQEALNRIQSTLNQYTAKIHNVITHHAVGTGPLQYAAGGLIPLTNASTPFGNNVRFGEEGTEAGMLVFQHSIAKSLRNQARTGQIGPFYVNKSDDWLKDRYDLKRIVEEAVDRAIRR